MSWDHHWFVAVKRVRCPFDSDVDKLGNLQMWTAGTLLFCKESTTSVDIHFVLPQPDHRELGQGNDGGVGWSLDGTLDGLLLQSRVLAVCFACTPPGYIARNESTSLSTTVTLGRRANRI